MTATIYQIRDFQNKRDLARLEADLNRQAVEIINHALFGSVQHLYDPLDATQANAFHQPKDPA